MLYRFKLTMIKCSQNVAQCSYMMRFSVEKYLWNAKHWPEWTEKRRITIEIGAPLSIHMFLASIQLLAVRDCWDQKLFPSPLLVLVQSISSSSSNICGKLQIQISHVNLSRNTHLLLPDAPIFLHSIIFKHIQCNILHAVWHAIQQFIQLILPTNNYKNHCLVIPIILNVFLSEMWTLRENVLGRNLQIFEKKRKEMSLARAVIRIFVLY